MTPSCQTAGHDTHLAVHISRARFFVIRTILSFPGRGLTKRCFYKAPTPFACALDIAMPGVLWSLQDHSPVPSGSQKARRESTQRYPFKLTQTKNLQPHQMQNKEVDNSSQPGPKQKTTRVDFQKGFLVA